MHVSSSQYKWICRISIKQENKLFTLHKFNDSDYETEFFFDEVELLEQIKELIEDTYEKCKNMWFAKQLELEARAAAGSGASENGRKNAWTKAISRKKGMVYYIWS